jgi:hypothetical protein
LLPELAFCALMVFSGCDESDMYEAAGTVSGGGTHGFNVSGHWLGTTGAGTAFTMDLSSSNSNAIVSGSMTREGVAGTFDGSIEMDVAHLSFTVTWPDGGETTGDANVYDEGHMKHGTLTESGVTDTFSAERQ